MQPLWNRIVKIGAIHIGTNLLTFSGFLFILINYFLLSFYDWDYTASGASPGIVPTWVWLFGACTTFCAYALDWEKYNTGVLFLPWGYDLSQVTLIAMYLVIAPVGVEVWHKPFLFGYYITDMLVILLIDSDISTKNFLSQETDSIIVGKRTGVV